MLAAVISRYGPPDVVTCRDVPPPAAGSGQVLVRVRAASLNPLDTKLRAGSLWPFVRVRFPAVLGFDLAGEVAAVGPGVSAFAVGQRVYGRTDSATGGTHAEFAAVAARVLDHIPETLTFEEAASLPLVAMTSIQGLRDIARIRAGERLLVNGAAGGVGTTAVQIGRALGAEVTAVARNEHGDLLRSLGASRVLDYTRGDLDRADPTGFDVVFDTVTRLAWRELRRLLTGRRMHVATGFSPALAARTPMGWLPGQPRVHFLVSRADGDGMRAVSDFVARGQLHAVIDSTWPLTRIREAWEHLENGRVRGKVVLAVP